MLAGNTKIKLTLWIDNGHGLIRIIVEESIVKRI